MVETLVNHILNSILKANMADGDRITGGVWRFSTSSFRDWRQILLVFLGCPPPPPSRLEEVFGGGVLLKGVGLVHEYHGVFDVWSTSALGEMSL